MKTSNASSVVSLTEKHATALLRGWLGGGVVCRSFHPLDGGFCNAVYRLEFDAPPHAAVLKLNNPLEDDPLPRECVRLQYLLRETKLPFPRVYLQDASKEIVPFSFLLLECLPGIHLDSADLAAPARVRIETGLAEACAELHAHTAETFHAVGDSPGVREWTEVFLPDLEENRRDMEAFLSKDLLRKIDKVLPLVERALRDQGEPTLIHNDLWGGNILVEERAEGWRLSGLLDPVGLQYADVEKELAYLQAFSTVGDVFFRVYSSRKAIREGFEYRKLFYWLDTYMTHVWLGFGSEFHQRIAATCDQIAAH